MRWQGREFLAQLFFQQTKLQGIVTPEDRGRGFGDRSQCQALRKPPGDKIRMREQTVDHGAEIDAATTLQRCGCCADATGDLASLEHLQGHILVIHAQIEEDIAPLQQHFSSLPEPGGKAVSVEAESQCRGCFVRLVQQRSGQGALQQADLMIMLQQLPPGVGRYRWL